MLLLVGLGNPGRDYTRSRHNIGFMAVDEIADRYGFAPFRKRFQGLVAEGQVAGEKLLALKPTTYMNESGRAVAEAVRFYKLPLEQVIVIHDEIDLAAGKIRVKRGGGTAGHRGLKSLDAHLGDPGYRRVRLGVGHPGARGRVHNHVLGDFSKADRAGWVTDELAAIAAAFPDLVRGDDAGFTNRLALTLGADRQPAKAPKDRNKKDRAPAGAAPAGAASAASGPASQPASANVAAPPAPAPAPPRTALGAAIAAALARLRHRD